MDGPSPLERALLETSLGRALSLGGSFDAVKRSQANPTTRGALASQRAHRDARSLHTLIADCQQAARNSPVAGAIIRARQAAMVGRGPAVVPASADPKWNATVRDAWDEWCESGADAGGMLSFAQMLGAWVESCATDGGSAWYKIAANGRTPGRLQTVELARMVNQGNRPDDDTTRAGITTDDMGRPVSYWIHDWTHYGTLDFTGGREVDADLMIYAPAPSGLTPGQLRAEPTLAKVLDEIEWMGNSVRAIHDAFMVAACFAVYTRMVDPSIDIRETLAASMVKAGLADNITEAKAIGELRPGAVFNLGLNEEMGALKPEHPNTAFDEFYKSRLRLVCAAMDIPMSMVWFAFDKSYSASRAELAAAWTRIRMDQAYMRTRIISPSYRFWLRGEIGAGRIADRPDRFAHSVRFDPMPVLDLKQEAEAMTMLIAGGLKTREDALYEMGDPQPIGVFFDRRGAEIEREKELGIETSKPAQVTRTEDAREESGAVAQ